MKTNYAPHVYKIAEILSTEYHDFNHYNKRNPLDELLFIICSIKRTEKVYLRAFRSLKRAFPRFENLAKATTKELVNKVDWGGLQNQKAASVEALMRAIVDRFDQPSLFKLKHMNDEMCEEFLSSLPGVGKKVARCVMLYSLGRNVFPVDTHCWRVAQRLGWVASGNTPTSKNVDRLQNKIPPPLRFSLHINMVSFGREICTARAPKCYKCEIMSLCKKAGKGDRLLLNDEITRPLSAGQKHTTSRRLVAG